MTIRPHMRSVETGGVTPAEFHILLALADEDRHGYAVMQQVAAESGGAVRLGPGTLYGAIKRLLESGLIHEVESRVDPELDDARRKYYRLSEAGREALVAEAGRLADLIKLARRKKIFEDPARAAGGRP